MTTPSHRPARPWGADVWQATEEEQEQRSHHADEHGAAAEKPFPSSWDAGYDEEPASDWASADEAFAPPVEPWARHDESAGEGLSGRALVLITALAAGGCAAFDLALTSGRMTFFFDLCFVVICLVAAMAVRRDDLFTAGVLPPLLFAVVIAVVTGLAPHAFESAPGANKVFLSGLASHAAGLVGGYAATLLTVAARMVASADRTR
jgi:hypothetical protein